MADKESEDWYKDVREKQIKRGSASKDDKDLLALADKLLGGNSQMLVKYNSFPEYEVLKDGKTYRINPETNTAEEIKSNDKLDNEVVNDFAIDAIKDNFTPPGAKDEEENVPGENYKRYPSFMKKKADDELDEYLKDLDKYLSKNPKGRDDIPVTTRR